MLEGIEFDVPFVARRTTLLYGLPLRGANSGDVESLRSYLCSLADSHCVSVSALVDFMSSVPQLHTQRAGMVELERAISDPTREVMTFGRSSAGWVDILEAATGTTVLTQATLLALTPHITGEELIDSNSRICRECIKGDVASGQLPYGRLLWQLREVSCCTLHRAPLVSRGCGSEPSARAARHLRKRMSGVCTACGSLAYCCRKEPSPYVSPEDVRRAEQCRDLVSRLSQIGRTSPEVMKEALRRHCDSTAGGIAGVAKRAGVSKSGLWRWLKLPSVRTSLQILLRVAAGEGFELAGMLMGDLAHRNRTVASPCATKRVTRGRVDTMAVRHVMRAAVDRGYGIPTVVSDLGVDRGTLSRLCPEDYAHLVTRAAEVRERQLVDVQRGAVLRAEEAYVRMRERGLTPSLRNARSVTGSDWWPRAWPTVALIRLRIALDGAKLKVSLPSVRCRPEFFAELAEACERIRQKTGTTSKSLTLDTRGRGS